MINEGDVLCVPKKPQLASCGFFYYIGNINLKKRTKNIHKMGASTFKENAGTQKDTFKMWRKLFI